MTNVNEHSLREERSNIMKVINEAQTNISQKNKEIMIRNPMRIMYINLESLIT